MANEQKIDVSKYLAGVRVQSGGRAESEGVSWQNQPQRETRSQPEKESSPDYYQRQQRERGR